MASNREGDTKLELRQTIRAKSVFIAGIAVAVMWGSAFVSIREALHSFSSGSLSIFRYLIASLVMLPIYLRLPKRNKPNPTEWVKIAIQGAIGVALYNYANNQSEVTLSAATSSFMISQAPLGISLISILVLKEKPTRRRWVGMLLSTIGIIIIAGANNAIPWLQHNDPGVFWSGIAVLSASVFWVCQKPLLEKFNPTELMTLCIWTGTIWLLGYLPQLSHELPHAKLIDIANVAYLAFFPATLAYALWTYVISALSPSRAAGFLYLMPISALILGWILLGEHIGLFEFCGGMVALGGAYVMQSGAAAANTDAKASID